MFLRISKTILKDEVWSKVITVGVILFLILTADAILSFWVPNFMQDSFKSSFVMGLVMSFSSIVGFGVDLVFPQILRKVNVKSLIFWAIATSLVFCLLLLRATFTPFLIILLSGMAVWGLYYEFLGFGQQQFIAESTPHKLHSAAWGVLSIFRSLGYFIGPILGGLLLTRGERIPLYFAFLLVISGLGVLFVSKSKTTRPVEIQIHEVSLIREIGYWKILFAHVWPVVLLSLFMGLVDATFWTTGAVWSEKLAEKSFFGGMFLSIYMFPSLFMGFIVAKWKIFTGKKKIAEKFLLFSGLFLALIGITNSIPLQLIFVLISSVLMSISFPLTDAVYSDIISRMGKEREHLIGLSCSTTSLAYIIGPAWSGFIANQVGEKLTFSFVGVTVIILSIVLLFTTPKKLKLPQEEIKRWQ